jgi:hypothetical protein
MQCDLQGEWELRLPGIASVPIDAVQVTVETFSKPILVRARLPPELRPTTLVYEDVDGRVSIRTPVTDLPFGFDTRIEADRFYIDVLGREFYCESASADEISMVLLGHQQLSKRIWADFTAKRTAAERFYVEVTDSAAIERLRCDYSIWTDAKAKGKTRSHGFLKEPSSGAVLMPPGFFEGLREELTVETLWKPTVSIELEIRRPNGEITSLVVLNRQQSDPRLTDGFTFGPTVNASDNSVVFVSVFDRRTSAPGVHVVDVALRVGGEWQETPTSPTSSVRVVRVL